MKNPLLHVLTKVKYLLYLESKLEPEERAQHQWQMLTMRGKVKYVFGKGGANTCFLIVDDKRETFYPDDFVARIKVLARQKYASYGIYSGKKKKVIKHFCLLHDALEYVPTNSDQTVVGIDDHDVLHQTHYASKTLTGIEWVKCRTGGRDEKE